MHKLAVREVEDAIRTQKSVFLGGLADGIAS
jgi:hypothetical protein